MPQCAIIATSPNMFFKLARDDIHVFKGVYSVGNALAVIPVYNFEKAALVGPKLVKFYAAFLLACEAVGLAWMIYLRISSSTSYNFFKFSFHVLGPCDTIMLSMLKISVIFGLCCCKQTDWENLNNNFQFVDKKFNTVNSREGILRNVYVQFGVLHLLYFCCVAYSLGVRAVEKGGSVLKLFALYEFNAYYDFYVQVLMHNLVLAFRIRYKHLNQRLVGASSDASIRECRKMAQILGEMVHIFNGIFGFPVLFILGRCVVKMLVSLNFFTNSLDLGDLTLKHRLEISAILQTLLVLVSTSVLISACDATKSESEKSLFLCFKLRENFIGKSEKLEELSQLTQIIDKYRAVFTAANFFQIDRSTFLGILSTTTTYLIVTLQFNQTWNGVD